MLNTAPKLKGQTEEKLESSNKIITMASAKYFQKISVCPDVFIEVAT
jgi:hypothetical protein